MPSIRHTPEFETLAPDEKWTVINKNLIDNMINMDWGLQVRQIIYYLTLNVLIRREKKGSSYALFSIKN